MTDLIYGTLETVGFAHPLHPALTHIPMGMVIGCFFFGLAALYTKNTLYLKTALHSSVVGLLFIIPTIVAGILDWQHYYGGTMSGLIIGKFVLAIILTILLAYSVVANRQGSSVKKMFIIYALCLACAGGLGFSGGELVYGG